MRQEMASSRCATRPVDPEHRSCSYKGFVTRRMLTRRIGGSLVCAQSIMITSFNAWEHR